MNPLNGKDKQLYLYALLILMASKNGFFLYHDEEKPNTKLLIKKSCVYSTVVKKA